VPWISLVNLVLGQALVPEFWKPPVESQALVAALRPLLNERSPERTRQQEGFRRVRELLGSRDAAGAVAEMVLGLAGV
jgi:lipid A disaccharide synthetase